MSMRKQSPFLNKSFFPGGATDLIDRKSKGIQSSGPVLDKGSNVDLGDIISFNYIGRELLEANVQPEVTNTKLSDRVVLNPLIIFAGYDAASQCIMGVDIKRFVLDKQTAALTATLSLLRKFYYYQEEDGGRKMWHKRSFTEVPYNGPLAFRYENFGGAWGSIGKLLIRYFKSYKPSLMRQVIIMPPDIAERETNGTVKTLPGIKK